MDSSTLPEWKKALLERKRAKRAAEAARLPSGDGFSPLRRRPAAASLSRLLELYSTMPGVRTIRADRIVIIETCPGEAAKPRVQGAAELRAEQVVVYEPEPGHVRRLRHQFDPGRAGGATRMRRCGACGRKEASGCALRMSEGHRAASGDELRMSEGQRGASDCPLRMCEGRRNVSLWMPEKPMDASSRIGQEEASRAPVRMPERQSNAPLGMPEGAKEVSSSEPRMLGDQLADSPRSRFVQKIAANSFLVNPRGRRAIDPKERATDPREGGWLATEEGTWPGATVLKESARAATPHTMRPKESAWPASADSMVPKEITWLASPDAMRSKESTWAASPNPMVPKERAWLALPDATVPKESALAALPDPMCPKENTWPASPDARVPKESAWTTSERRATNHEDAGRQEGARPASPKGPERRATDSEESGWTSLEPYYGSQGRPCSVSPRGWELHTTNPKKTPSLRDATDPKGRLRGTIATRAVAAPGTDAALSPSASLRRNSHNSFQVVPRPRGAQVPRWAPAPQEPDRVPVTCIDEDATGSLPPLKVLSPRLEGCDVSDDSPLALDSEDATLGPGFESSLLLQNGSREAPGADFEGALPRGRYPRADEIEVIGGYLSLDRSCMSKAGARRRKKLKISFDDSRLHTMFEYPSENSLVAEEQEEEVEGEEEEEEYASEVDEAPPLPSAKRAAPSCRPNSGFSSYTPKLHSEEGGRFKEAPPKLGTVVPGADSPDNHVMLTPAGAGALSDFSSEPALYF